MTDLEGRAFTKKIGALWPADEHAMEYFDSLPDGKEVLITGRRPRSVQHHKRAMKLLRNVVNNTDKWGSVEELLDALKHAMGHTEVWADLRGNKYTRPKSISFGAMDEIVFREWETKAVALLAEELGWDPETLMDQGR